MIPASVMALEARSSMWASPPMSTNSTVAPNNAAARFASRMRRPGVPFVPDSPREQTTKCTLRPVSFSRAMMPPHPNSISSGCAPNARIGAGLLFVAVMRWEIERFACEIKPRRERDPIYPYLGDHAPAIKFRAFDARPDSRESRLTVSFIRAVDWLTAYELDLRSVCLSQVRLFAGARNIVG